jgi:hypothetical protein
MHVILGDFNYYTFKDLKTTFLELTYPIHACSFFVALILTRAIIALTMYLNRPSTKATNLGLDAIII